MKALLELLDSDIVEANVEIVSFTRDEGSLTLRVEIRDQEGSGFVSRWLVLCKSPLDYRVLPGSGSLHVHRRDTCRVHANSWIHAWTSSSTCRELTFWRPRRRFGRSPQHRRRVDPFDRYFNRAFRPTELLRKQSGKLASGPVFLIDAYARALADFKVTTSRVAEFVHVLDLPRVPGDDRLSLLQDRFIVCRGAGVRGEA